MSEAKDPEPEYDLLDVVGGGLEKCARNLFGRPGDFGPAMSKSVNNQSGQLTSSDEMKENRGDAEDERREAPSVLPPSLNPATIKFPDIEAAEMPDIGGQIENMTAKVLAVGNCQGFEGRPELPYLKSLWALGGGEKEATKQTNSRSKTMDKANDPLDDASLDSAALSFSSAVDCCALLDPREREFDRETFWEDGDIDDGSEDDEVDDDDIPADDNSAPTASALLVQVATTIDSFKAKRQSVAPIIESPTFPAASGKEEATKAEEAPIYVTASDDSDTSTVASAQQGVGCSIHKSRWKSLLRNKIIGNAEKPHVLKHCEKGRCSNVPDHGTKMMNRASSTLSFAHSSALEAIEGRRWKVLLDLVKANPHILSLHSSAMGGGTLLHALAASVDAPDTIVLQILSIWPNLAGCLNDADSTPLHIAAMQPKRPGLVKLFSNYHVNSASIQNINGDSPLHYAASAGSEDSTLILLNANKQMLTIPNRKGQIPLHVACYSKRPSIEVVRNLLLHHKAIGDLPSSIDKDDKTPLCAAIGNKESSKLVPIFCHEMPDLFRLGDINETTTDSGTSLSLHTALLQSHIDERTLLCILEASPDAAAVPLPRGDLPIVVATRRGLSDDVIYSILVQDLPIAILGPDKKGVSVKKHNYSWHHVLANSQERYGDVVNKVLQKANFWQRITLALSPSFFGRLAYDSCSEPTKTSFDVALCIGGRFHIKLDCIESLSFDRNYNVLSATDTAPPKNHDGDKLSNSSAVTIRCYSNEKKVVDELFVRRGHRISDMYAEKLILHLNTIHDLVPTPFPLAFEKSNGTLQEFLSEINQANEAPSSEAKLEKIRQQRRQVFMQIALCLDHFHKKGLVHSDLSPENIGLFSDGWKLMSIGGSTPIFTAIDSNVKGYVPPEAIERFKPIDPIESRQYDATDPGLAVSGDKSAKLRASRRHVGRKWGVLFSLRDLGLQKSLSVDVDDLSAKRNEPSMLQVPKLSQEWNYRIGSDITASPTLDIFAFGLIFVQSYIVSNLLLPTTYDKVYGFNNEHLKDIMKEMEAIAGKEATDLVAMTLQPSPLKRAQTMTEILEHEYFTNASSE